LKSRILDANIRGISLPSTVHGCILPNADGTFDIYYNSNLCREQCLHALSHELEHLSRGHLYDAKPARENENEVGREAALL